MLTIYGEGRGFRPVWLLEEMGIPYRLRSVDLLAGVENDPEFLAINPGGFIPEKYGDTIPVAQPIDWRKQATRSRSAHPNESS